MLSSLQTPQKSPKTPVKVAGFLAFDKKKVARRMICLCYNQCLKWGKKVAVAYSLCIGKSLHFYSEKQNLEILLLQQFIVIYLLTT